MAQAMWTAMDVHRDAARQHVKAACAPADGAHGVWEAAWHCQMALRHVTSIVDVYRSLQALGGAPRAPAPCAPDPTFVPWPPVGVAATDHHMSQAWRHVLLACGPTDVTQAARHGEMAAWHVASFGAAFWNAQALGGALIMAAPSVPDSAAVGVPAACVTGVPAAPPRAPARDPRRILELIAARGPLATKAAPAGGGPPPMFMRDTACRTGGSATRP